jgi:hypothetical protein
MKSLPLLPSKVKKEVAWMSLFPGMEILRPKPGGFMVGLLLNLGIS